MYTFVCWGWAVSVKGELCFWTHISQRRPLVCCFKSTPCADVRDEAGAGNSIAVVYFECWDRWMAEWMTVDASGLEIFIFCYPFDVKENSKHLAV